MGGSAFRSQPHEQPADLRGRRLAAHHDAEHLGSLIFGERLAVGERAQRAAQRRIHGGLRLSPLSNSDNELHLSPGDEPPPPPPGLPFGGLKPRGGASRGGGGPRRPGPPNRNSSG